MSGRTARFVLVPILSLVVIGLLILLGGAVAKVVSRPRGMDVLPRLEREFAAFEPPAAARVVEAPESHSKTSHALVIATYAVPMEYESLRRHFDEEATRLGWTPCGEKPLYDWFRDLGGRGRRYCKGQMAAYLQYSGAHASYGWSFAFSVSWGLH